MMTGGNDRAIKDPIDVLECLLVDRDSAASLLIAYDARIAGLLASALDLLVLSIHDAGELSCSDFALRIWQQCLANADDPTWPDRVTP